MGPMPQPGDTYDDDYNYFRQVHTTVSEEKKEEDTSIKLEADETLDIPNTHKTKTNQEVSQELLYGSYDV